jgi:hypothetical protein
VQQHISENEKLEAELAEKIKMTQKLVRDMADAREEQAIRNAKESNDLKEEIKILKVRMTQPTWYIVCPLHYFGLFSFFDDYQFLIINVRSQYIA